MGLLPDSPGSVSYAAPSVDFSPLGDLFKSYYDGNQMGLQMAKQSAFKNGPPTINGDPNGPLDFNAAAKKMMRYDPRLAMEMAQSGQTFGAGADMDRITGVTADATGAPTSSYGAALAPYGAGVGATSQLPAFGTSPPPSSSGPASSASARPAAASSGSVPAGSTPPSASPTASAASGGADLIMGRYTIDQAKELADKLHLQAARLAANPALARSAQMWDQNANRLDDEIAKRTAVPEFRQIGLDANGFPQPGFVNLGKQSVTIANPQGGPGGANGSGTDAGLKGQPYLDALKARDPARASMVEGMIEGRTPFPGAFALKSPMIQSYLRDAALVDPTFDASKWQARSTAAKELAKATPGSIGGQITFAGTSLGHLAEVAEKASALENWSGGGIAPLARIINSARGLSTDQASKINGVEDAVQHFGQEITKFYAGSPGGEAERNRFLSTMSAAKSPEEIAGAIRSERDLIPSRLEQIRGQLVDQLGQSGADKFMARANLDKVVPRINEALAKLDPNGPEAQELKLKASQQSPGAGTSRGPQSQSQGGRLAPGAVVGGYRYRGGNPKDRSSWERVQ